MQPICRCVNALTHGGQQAARFFRGLKASHAFAAGGAVISTFRLVRAILFNKLLLHTYSFIMRQSRRDDSMLNILPTILIDSSAELLSRISKTITPTNQGVFGCYTNISFPIRRRMNIDAIARVHFARPPYARQQTVMSISVSANTSSMMGLT